MDRMSHYRVLIERLLREQNDLAARCPEEGIEPLYVFDEERDLYLLMDTGWAKGKRVQNLYLYVRLKDGKIWIEEDWTEEGLANLLVREGISKDDIVLAFQPPNMRPHTEFAVA